jgi:hypothetical protein
VVRVTRRDIEQVVGDYVVGGVMMMRWVVAEGQMTITCTVSPIVTRNSERKE